MSQTNIKQTRIKNRIDTQENWYTNNPILLEGEIGIEKDTGIIKIGNGNNNYNDLPVSNDITYVDNFDANINPRIFGKDPALFVTDDTISISQLSQNLYSIKIPKEFISLSKGQISATTYGIYVTIAFNKFQKFAQILSKTPYNIPIQMRINVQIENIKTSTSYDITEPELNVITSASTLTQMSQTSFKIEKIEASSIDDIDLDDYSIDAGNWINILPTLLSGKKPTLSTINPNTTYSFVYTQGFSYIVMPFSEISTKSDISNFISSNQTNTSLNPKLESNSWKTATEKIIKSNIKTNFYVTNTDGVYSSTVSSIPLSINANYMDLNTIRIDGAQNDEILLADLPLVTDTNGAVSIDLSTSDSILQVLSSDINNYTLESRPLPETGKKRLMQTWINKVYLPLSNTNDLIYSYNGYPIEIKTQNSVIDNLESTNSSEILSANQGRVLKGLIDNKTEVEQATKANKLTTSRKIGLSNGAVSDGIYFNGTSDINIPVKYLRNNIVTWNASENAVINTTSIIDDALTQNIVNIFDFYPPEYVSIEYSRDGGVTWTDNEYTDEEKTKFLTPILKSNKWSEAETHISIGNSNSNTPVTTDFQSRITINSFTSDNQRIIYAKLRKLILVCSSAGGAAKITLQGAPLQDKENFTTIKIFDAVGDNKNFTINLNAVFFGGNRLSNTESDKYYSLRLIFSITGTTSGRSNSFSIYSLQGMASDIFYFNPNYFNTCWKMTGKPYQVNLDKSVTFMGDIYGNLNGIATKAEQDSDGNIISDTYLKTSDDYNGSTFLQIPTLTNLTNAGRNVVGCRTKIGTIRNWNNSKHTGVIFKTFGDNETLQKVYQLQVEESTTFKIYNPQYAETSYLRLYLSNQGELYFIYLNGSFLSSTILEVYPINLENALLNHNYLTSFDSNTFLQNVTATENSPTIIEYNDIESSYRRGVCCMYPNVPAYITLIKASGEQISQLYTSSTSIDSKFNGYAFVSWKCSTLHYTKAKIQMTTPSNDMDPATWIFIGRDNGNL